MFVPLSTAPPDDVMRFTDRRGTVEGDTCESMPTLCLPTVGTAIHRGDRVTAGVRGDDACSAPASLLQLVAVGDEIETGDGALKMYDVDAAVAQSQQGDSFVPQSCKHREAVC